MVTQQNTATMTTDTMVTTMLTVITMETAMDIIILDMDTMVTTEDTMATVMEIMETAMGDMATVISGGSKGVPLPGPNFSQFHAVFFFLKIWQDRTLAPPPPGETWRPSYGESWIRLL